MNSSKNEQIDAYDQNLDQNYHKGLKAIQALTDAGFEARFAGGCVRDRLLGRRPKDYDVATNAKPDQICSVFAQKNIKTVPTGIDHGTITVVIGGQGLEITTLRLDVATDGRRAVVAFGESFEEDSLRRDFTINALYEDAQGKVYDYHGGQADLAQRILRFVGDAETRIREDYLRILRLFRFWARFGLEPAPGTLEAVRKEVRGLEQISAERITSELLLTLECQDFPKVLPALYQTGTLNVTLSLTEDAETLNRPWTALYLNKKTNTALGRFAALLWNLPTLSAKKLSVERLRFSRQQKDKVMLLFEEVLPKQGTDPAEVFEWLDRVEARAGESAWNDFLYPVWSVLRPDPALKVLDQTIQTNLARRVCSIDSQSLIKELGIAPGPELGALLQDLKREYRRGLWTSPEDALKRAKILVSNRTKPRKE